MAHRAIVTFTARNREWVLNDGGSQAWRLNSDEARKAEFLVCTQNRNNTTGFGEPTAPHRAAFLIGRVAGIVPSPDNLKRWLIQIQDYAILEIPEVWPKLRYPVWYTTLEDLGIDPDGLTFRPLPPVNGRTLGSPVGAPPFLKAGHFTIADAKAALATSFGVPEDAIEITIRG